MILRLFKKNSLNRQIIEAQYAILTGHGRRPVFYQDFSVPDTVIGRFEMLSAVLILYFRRTARSAERGKEIAQRIAEAFFEDLDHSFRELGIGDHGVPKRMKIFTGMFYGRLESYGKALDAKDETMLAQALLRNFHPENTDTTLSMAPLADYMLAAEEALSRIVDDEIVAGQVTILKPQAGGPK
jgi:cytochrome b pre-mRNA-processing protein 3